jgi:hypothetical protein
MAMQGQAPSTKARIRARRLALKEVMLTVDAGEFSIQQRSPIRVGWQKRERRLGHHRQPARPFIEQKEFIQRLCEIEVSLNALI